MGKYNIFIIHINSKSIRKFVCKIFLRFWKKSPQSYIYFIKNTVKTVIF